MDIFFSQTLQTTHRLTPIHHSPSQCYNRWPLIRLGDEETEAQIADMESPIWSEGSGHKLNPQQPVTSMTFKEINTKHRNWVS